MLFLLEILLKQQSQVLTAIASVMILILYTMDGWFFGYYNAKLRRRYAKVLGCRRKEDEEEAPMAEGNTADGGAGVPQAAQQQQQQQQRRRDGHWGLTRAAWVTPEAGGGSAPPVDTGGRQGTGTCGTIWVVPPMPHAFIDVPIATQASAAILGKKTAQPHESKSGEVASKEYGHFVGEKRECPGENRARSAPLRRSQRGISDGGGGDSDGDRLRSLASKIPFV